MSRTAIPAVKSERPDWYKEVTDSLVNEMKRALTDGSSWKKSWAGLWKYGLPLRNNNVSFTGINVWLLAIAANANGYVDPRWYTFDQAKEAVGYKKNPAWKGKCDTFKGIPKWIWTGKGEDPRLGVRSGEKGTHVIRCTSIPIFVDMNGARVYPPRATAPEAVRNQWNANLASGQVRQKGAYTSINSYVVFNASQIDGMPQVETRTLAPGEGYLNAEVMVDLLRINVVHLPGCDTAAYHPVADQIIMPCPEQFESEAAYWAVKLHEVTHWTGHQSRLNRGFHLGEEDYAFEELVAEIGSAFLCAHLGIEGDLRHPEYLASWIKVLQGDSKAIFKAATMAQKAVDFIVGGGGLVNSEEDSEEDSETAVAA